MLQVKQQHAVNDEACRIVQEWYHLPTWQEQTKVLKHLECGLHHQPKDMQTLVPIVLATSDTQWLALVSNHFSCVVQFND